MKITTIVRFGVAALAIGAFFGVGLPAAHRWPCGENHERIGLTNIGPSAWKISHLSILGIVKHPPLAPTQAAIDKLKLPPTPGVKRMSYTKISC